MFKKLVSIMLVGVLSQAVCVSPVMASTKTKKEVREIKRVRAGVTKIGTGPAARVTVKLKDGTKLDGYVSEVGTDSFVIVNAESGVLTPVAYPQVKVVKGNNLSTGAKIAIGLGIALGLAILIGLSINDG